MKVRAVIIDDEVKLQQVLKIKVEKFCPLVEIVGVASTVEEAYDLIQTEAPDLIFLDIIILNQTGFDLLDMFPTIPFEIIFVTGHSEFAIKAFKLSAIDYLLKPVSTKELIAGVNKAINKIEGQINIEKYNVFKENFNKKGDQNNKIAIYDNKSYSFVQVKDIIRCEGWKRYSKIFLKNSTCMVSSQSIGVYKESLEYFGFFSTHKSHLINTTLISKYLKEGIVIMTDNSQVPVSRRKKEEFQQKFINGNFS